MNKWIKEGDLLKNAEDESEIEFKHPIIIQGMAIKTDKGRLDVRERKKKNPTVSIYFRRWKSIEGDEPILPKILDGRKVRISIEVLD